MREPAVANKNRLTVERVGCEEIAKAGRVEAPGLRQSRRQTVALRAPIEEPLARRDVVETQRYTANVLSGTMQIAVFEIRASAPEWRHDRCAVARIPLPVVGERMAHSHVMRLPRTDEKVETARAGAGRVARIPHAFTARRNPLVIGGPVRLPRLAAVGREGLLEAGIAMRLRPLKSCDDGLAFPRIVRIELADAGGEVPDLRRRCD